MGPINVRELAAVDLHGASGSTRRRRIILTEFVLGAAVGPVLGAIVIAGGGPAAIFGAWVLGIGLNYVPLAIYAIRLRPADRLEGELTGIDIRSALRHYTRTQFWIAVPLLFVVLDVAQRRAGGRTEESG